MGKLSFKELSNKKYKEQRNIVISEAFDTDNSLKGYSIAEQLVAQEGENQIAIFLKGGLGIVDKQGLLQLKEAVDEACAKIGLLKNP